MSKVDFTENREAYEFFKEELRWELYNSKMNDVVGVVKRRIQTLYILEERASRITERRSSSPEKYPSSWRALKHNVCWDYADYIQSGDFGCIDTEDSIVIDKTRGPARIAGKERSGVSLEEAEEKFGFPFLVRVFKGDEYKHACIVIHSGPYLSYEKNRTSRGSIGAFNFPQYPEYDFSCEPIFE